jgi:hypothetical protein
MEMVLKNVVVVETGQIEVDKRYKNTAVAYSLADTANPIFKLLLPPNEKLQHFTVNQEFSE